MRSTVGCLLLLLLLSSTASAADEIHWTFSGPTSVTFDWRGADSTLSYGLPGGALRTAVGHAPTPVPFSSAGPFWEARLDGLAPGTAYRYSVAGGPSHTFHTEPAGPASFTIYVEADVGDSTHYWRVADVQSLIAAGTPDFALVVGDLSYGDDNGAAAVDHHFNDVMVWSQDAAYMPIWGNHDWGSSVDDLRNYKGRFELPNEQTSPGSPSVSCCGEDWYWFDYGGVRFIAYPEPFTSATWSDWASQAAPLMDQAQADPAIRFIVTFGHRPAYSSGHHLGSPALQGYLDALGDSHSKYVLNLNGHSHDYERSDPQHGVTHVTLGIGGSSLEPETGTCTWLGGCPPPSWSAFRAYHHGALRLRFTGSAIQGEAICGPPSPDNDIACAAGEAFDSFTIGSDLAPLVEAPPSVDAAPATQVRITVTASDPDGEPIDSLTADLSQLPPDNNATFETSPGNKSGLLTWTPAAADTGTYRVVFRAANAIVVSDTTEIVVAGATGGPGPRLALADVFPNPARARLRIAYSLATGDPARLELMTLSGRVLWRQDLGSPGPGTHQIDLGRGQGVTAGHYWLRLTQARRSVVREIVYLP